METRIEKVKQFTVKGYEMNGPVTQISRLWNEFNTLLKEKGSTARESFGITVGMDNGSFHYLAGVRAELAAEFPNTTEVTIPEGKYIVAKVEGGIESIPSVFDALMRYPDVTLRHSYGFERYIHPAGSSGYKTEVWVAIE